MNINNVLQYLKEDAPIYDSNGNVDLEKFKRQVTNHHNNITVDPSANKLAQRNEKNRLVISPKTEVSFNCSKHPNQQISKKPKDVLARIEKNICPQDRYGQQQSEAERIANTKVYNLLKRRGYKDDIWKKWFDPQKYVTVIPYTGNNKGNLDLDLFVEFPHDKDGHTGVFIDGNEKDGFGFAIDGVTHYKGTAYAVSGRQPKESEQHPYRQTMLNDIVRQYSVGGKKYRIYNYKLIQSGQERNDSPEQIRNWVQDCWDDIKSILSKKENYSPKNVKQEFADSRIDTIIEWLKDSKYADEKITLRNNKEISLKELASILDKNREDFNLGMWMKTFFNFSDQQLKSNNLSKEKIDEIMKRALSRSKFAKQLTLFLANIQNKSKTTI